MALTDDHQVRVALYVRVSSEEQAQGWSVESQRLEERISRAQDALLDGLVTKVKARSTIEDARAAMALLPAEEPLEIAGDALMSLKDALPLATEEERSRMVRLLFEEVTVDLAAGLPVSVVPRDVFLPLFAMGDDALCVRTPHASKSSTNAKTIFFLL